MLSSQLSAEEFEELERVLDAAERSYAVKQATAAQPLMDHTNLATACPSMMHEGVKHIWSGCEAKPPIRSAVGIPSAVIHDASGISIPEYAGWRNPAVPACPMDRLAASAPVPMAHPAGMKADGPTETTHQQEGIVDGQESPVAPACKRPNLSTVPVQSFLGPGAGAGASSCLPPLQQQDPWAQHAACFSSRPAVQHHMPQQICQPGPLHEMLNAPIQQASAPVQPQLALHARPAAQLCPVDGSGQDGPWCSGSSGNAAWSTSAPSRRPAADVGVQQAALLGPLTSHRVVAEMPSAQPQTLVQPPGRQPLLQQGAPGRPAQQAPTAPPNPGAAHSWPGAAPVPPGGGGGTRSLLRWQNGVEGAPAECTTSKQGAACQNHQSSVASFHGQSQCTGMFPGSRPGTSQQDDRQQLSTGTLRARAWPPESLRCPPAPASIKPRPRQGAQQDTRTEAVAPCDPHCQSAAQVTYGCPAGFAGAAPEAAVQRGQHQAPLAGRNVPAWLPVGWIPQPAAQQQEAQAAAPALACQVLSSQSQQRPGAHLDGARTQQAQPVHCQDVPPSSTVLPPSSLPAGPSAPLNVQSPAPQASGPHDSTGAPAPTEQNLVLQSAPVTGSVPRTETDGAQAAASLVGWAGAQLCPGVMVVSLLPAHREQEGPAFCHPASAATAAVVTCNLALSAVPHSGRAADCPDPSAAARPMGLQAHGLGGGTVPGAMGGGPMEPCGEGSASLGHACIPDHQMEEPVAESCAEAIALTASGSASTQEVQLAQLQPADGGAGTGDANSLNAGTAAPSSGAGSRRRLPASFGCGVVPAASATGNPAPTTRTSERPALPSIAEVRAAKAAAAAAAAGQQAAARPPSQPLPVLQFNGSVRYATTAVEVEWLCEQLLTARPPVVGLDMEWRPQFVAGAGENATALLQVCYPFKDASAHEVDVDGGRRCVCLLLHVAHSGITPRLRALLESEDVGKVGVNISGDAQKLRRDFQVDMRGALELDAVANQRVLQHIPNVCINVEFRSRWSLSALVEVALRRHLPKPNSIRCGNWERRPLDAAQRRYAALDAYAGLGVWAALARLPYRPKPLPPPGAAGGGALASGGAPAVSCEPAAEGGAPADAGPAEAVAGGGLCEP